MGNDISSNCGDGRTQQLTSATIKYLTNYHILPEYPSDRTKADKLIATTATKALKHVNTDFRSKIGGHSKRKYDSASDTLFPSDENIQSPKRRSPRDSSSSSPTSVNTAPLGTVISSTAIQKKKLLVVPFPIESYFQMTYSDWKRVTLLCWL